MRGKTAKRIRKFVRMLINNSNEDERGNKTQKQLETETKRLWRGNKKGQLFIKKAINGDFQ